jgi:L-alanine-DL-glutamate epimerase-like enolase superfamily enzyme
MFYEALRDFPVEIDRVETESLSLPISPEFTRRTTVVHLLGGGHEGVGEDVTYAGEEHGDRFPKLFLEGEWTIASLSARIDALELFPGGEPGQHAYLDYRRWAFESAALDLALRQAGRSLGDALGRESRPVRFVSSTRATALEPWLELYPELRFKLDPRPEWTDELIATLAARGNVDVVDLKGQYTGTVVDNPPNADLYTRIAAAFPEAWIEDPALTPETDAVLADHRDRVTWDAPIHSWADVEALPFPPRCLNVKPSRFGSLERLLEFYDRCAERGIALYGGGQFELGPGRGQIQLLASLFSADGPNDVAPGGYNDPEPRPGLETSPLEPRPEPTGFRRSLP